MKTNGLDGVSILVVEDGEMLAANLAEALGYAGARVVCVLGDLQAAMQFAESRYQEIHIVLLDVDLAGVMSYPVADILAVRDVPFIFMTGYDKASMDARYRSFPICMKPFNVQTAVTIIRRVLDSKTVPGQLQR